MYAIFTNGGLPKARVSMSVLFVRMIFLAHLWLAESQQSLRLKSYIFDSNVEMIQRKDCKQKLNF